MESSFAESGRAASRTTANNLRIFRALNRSFSSRNPKGAGRRGRGAGDVLATTTTCAPRPAPCPLSVHELPPIPYVVREDVLAEAVGRRVERSAAIDLRE